jgi:hypothetical protein
MMIRLIGIALALAAMAAWPADGRAAAEIAVDFAQAAGEIRPLHGGNGGPADGSGLLDLSASWRELAIPCTRLHDCLYPDPNVVDMHAVFPDPKADPERPESYDFARTDAYLGAIVKAGAQIVYRLGESIEHTKRKYRVHPPADPARWAAACLGVIRHYNEGWANGFHFNIRYWEIWNEPENRPAMWTGTDEDYFRLYTVTAKAIKARYPDLAVGGPSAGWSGPVEGERLRPTPFAAGLLAACQREGAPVDFFSWHIYTNDPAAVAARARATRRWLDESGFAKSESHLNEWNYLPSNDWRPMMLEGQGKDREAWYAAIGGAPGAAFTACVLVALQDCPVDVANYYTADFQDFGLFTRHGVPKKTFYAFKAFKALLDTPMRVEARGGESGRLAVAAGMARDKASATILVSNLRSAQDKIALAVKNLPWPGPIVYEVFILDAARDLEKVRGAAMPAGDLALSEDLKAPGLCLIRLHRPAAKN